ncbi:MAG: non-canonical purine NTP pyrophosphatase [Deltaproteobacteria bacterium]|nr:MAG: non-canonical purine NTP pyrophosphatase [Deltaproteobacteria bacterium]
MKRILVATLNKGKIREIKDILKDTGIEILTPDDINKPVMVEEDGKTFLENAVKKATAWMKATGIGSLADDSGLEVISLGGRPGVRSARFAGDNATDSDNVRLLLKSMEGIRDRRARFVCEVALALRDGRIITARGEYEGIILKSPVGENGFGYDPIFFDPSTGKTFAQLSGKEKNALSHRRRALTSLREKLVEQGIIKTSMGDAEAIT